MRRWLILLVPVGLLLIFALIVAAAHFAAVTEMERLEQETDACVARWRSDGYRRPALFGDPLPGDAADDYAAIRALVEALPPDQSRFLPGFSHIDMRDVWTPTADLASLRPAARTWAAGVERAFRRTDYRRERAYEEGMNAAALHRLGTIWGLGLAGAEAELRAGEVGAALRYLTLLMALETDELRGSEVYAVVHPLHILPLQLWERVLSDPRLPAGELPGLIRALERIEAEAPTPFDALRMQHELERIDLVLAYRGRQSNWANTEEPTWRDAYSKAIRTCGLLRGLERERHDLDALSRLPIHERPAAADRLFDLDHRVGEGRLWMGIKECFESDAAWRLTIRLARVGTAVAAFKAEKGRFPFALDELVPGQLAALPACPLTGVPFAYKDGKLWSRGFDRDDDGGRLAPGSEVWEDGDVALNLKP